MEKQAKKIKKEIKEKLETITIYKNSNAIYGIASYRVNNGITEFNAGGCNSFIRGMYEISNISEFRGYIPSHDHYTLDDFKNYIVFLNKCGFPCTFIEELTTEAFIDLHNIYIDNYQTASSNKINSFYVVEFDLPNIISKHHALAIWSCLRYWYVTNYSYIPIVAMSIQKLFPKLRAFRCLMHAHELKIYWDNFPSSSTYMTKYSGGYGLVGGVANIFPITKEEMLSNFKNGSSINISFSTNKDGYNEVQKKRFEKIKEIFICE